MNITPEDVKTWNNFDDDVKEEVIGNIKVCRENSEMNDDDHPKNQQYSDAFAVIVGILES